MMLSLGPKDLLGKKICRADGEPIGFIKGLHQTSCNGFFDEISIECPGGPVYAPMAALIPFEENFILLEDALAAAPAPDLPIQVPVALPLATPVNAMSPVRPERPVLPAPNVLTVQELTLTAVDAHLSNNSAISGRLGTLRITPSPSVSLRTRTYKSPIYGNRPNRTAPLKPNQVSKGMVANLEPPKPHAKPPKMKASGKQTGKGRSKMKSRGSARSFFNISTILERFI